MPEPDWTDPCAVLEWLRPHYYKVHAGRQTVTITHGGTTTTYSQANKSELASLFRQLQSECAAKQGSGGRRRAFVAG